MEPVSSEQLAQLREEVKQHGQEHLLRYWDDLSEEGKAQLRNDLLSADFSGMAAAFQRSMGGAPSAKLDDVMKPIPDDFLGRALPPTTEDMRGWESEGLRLIGEGKVALLLLAGGQGTRLGTTHPKGMFDLELPSKSTLYHLQGERLLRLQQLAAERTGKAGIIPWYIMTSGTTKAPTQTFFAENNHFGLEPADVTFFEQAQIPCMTPEGKFILKTKSSLARSPDGNGGLYAAMTRAGIVQDMVARGIECVHVYCVDNILVKPADPTFVGFCQKKAAPAGALVVGKSHPNEAVGVVCLCDNKYQVVEYSEISSTTAEKTNADGSLTFNAGNICNHYFTVDFLKSACKQEGDLTHHVAHKKIPFVNEAGETVKPEANNGIKMEKFVFDVFQFATELAVLEVARATNFSPLKNKVGATKCTVEHCRSDLYALHRQFLTAAGVTFVDEAGNKLEPSGLNESHVCEISPLVSYAGEGLAAFAKEHPTLKFPVHLSPAGLASPQ